jgi:bifunctional non-homologous end joining protein LigD
MSYAPKRTMPTVASQELIIEGHRVTLSNLDKVFYPDVEFTKGQVLEYYIRIAPFLLPHLKGRALTLKRYPNGVKGEFFYEKKCPSHRPPWVKTAAVYSEHRQADIDYCVVNDLATLVWAVNLADLELHTSLSIAKNPERPTTMVFDLDPGEPADVLDCARVSLWAKEYLEDHGLKNLRV